MKRMWTDEQKKALEINDKNTIVSAGAGSGKTAVLTTRVFDILKNRLASIDEIIVLTFTNAAAQEMRDRVRKNLIDSGLKVIADNIEASNITTFDAFALTLVKKYHYIFNLTDNINIIDESIIKVEEQRIIDSIFEDYYRSNDEVFNNMIRLYCVKSDDVLKNFVKDILSFKDLLIDEDDLFIKYKEKYLNENVFSEHVGEVISIIKKTYNEAIEQLNLIEDLKVVDSMRETLEGVLSFIDYDDMYMAIKQLKFPLMRDLEENDKVIRDNIKKNIQQFNKKIMALGDLDTMHSRFFNKEAEMAITKLIEISKKSSLKLYEYKCQHSTFTFSDIAKMALELVKKEDISREIKNNTKYIMIDEYQDTSDIQDAFISYISNNNVYMVGDTKQSIYRFRNANCELFQSKYDDYSDGNNGVKIDLTKNFRSRKEVIGDINNFYSILMMKEYGGVNYKKDHIIKVGNCDYDDHGKVDHSCVMEIYEHENVENKSELEARIIANDIIEKINSGYMVYDRSLKATRKCTYQDFAILDAGKHSFDVYQKVFDNASIPIKVYKEELIASSNVGYFFFNIVNFIYYIKNKVFDTNFVHAFVALARSFAVHYDDQKIHNIVTNKKIVEDELYKVIESTYLKYQNEPVDIILEECLKSLNFYRELVTIGNIDGNLSNIENLLNKVKSVASLGYGVDELFDYFSQLRSMNLEIKNENNEEAGNVVKMMTIHKSKGLEFPIVYLPSLDHKFNLADTKLAFSKSIKYGLILPLLDCDIDESVSVTRFLAKEKEIEETISEKIRLLYVAMTRAKEKIILLQNSEKKREGVFLSKANSFQDLVSYVSQKGIDFPTFNKNGEMTLKLIDVEDSQKEKQLQFYERSIIPNFKNDVERASKKAVNIDTQLLEKGNELHRLMELVDLKTRDCSFIKDANLKNRIEKVLKLPVLENACNGSVYKEYAYFDVETQTTGVIDLLVVYDNYIDIIDFKMWNMDDDAYKRQLNVYGSFIKKQFKKPINLYICSLLKGEYREIEQE